MDRHLTSPGRAVYRTAQCAAVAIVVLRAFIHETPPHAAAWFSLGLVSAGLFFLASVIRVLGGNIAGAIGLIVISPHPDLAAFSPVNALSFFCLSGLMFVAATRDWAHRIAYLIVALASLTGVLTHLSRGDGLRLHPLDPLRYSQSVGRVFLEYFGAAPGQFDPLLALESGVTLWWLYASVQSGSGVSFSLTAIPVAYVLCGSLILSSSASYAHPVHPILLANLISFLALWLRGRANKRVLDSTTN